MAFTPVACHAIKDHPRTAETLLCASGLFCCSNAGMILGSRRTRPRQTKSPELQQPPQVCTVFCAQISFASQGLLVSGVTT